MDEITCEGQSKCFENSPKQVVDVTIADFFK